MLKQYIVLKIEFAVRKEKIKVRSIIKWNKLNRLLTVNNRSLIVFLFLFVLFALCNPLIQNDLLFRFHLLILFNPVYHINTKLKSNLNNLYKFDVSRFFFFFFYFSLPSPSQLSVYLFVYSCCSARMLVD